MREHRPGRAERVRDGLAVALTAGSGALDAVCFLALGKVFASVITGNLVLLGLGLVGSEAEAAAHAGAAITAYVAGVAAGAAVAGQVVAQRAQWPRRVTAVLLVELALLVAFAVGWQLVGAPDAVPPGPGTGELGSAQHGPGRLVLLVLAAAAMGLQSVGVQRLAVSGFSTTYLTSTLIAVITELVTGTRRQLGFRSLALLGMVAGAVCGAALWHAAPRLAALPAPLVLATVLATAVWLRRGGRGLAG